MIIPAAGVFVPSTIEYAWTVQDERTPDGARFIVMDTKSKRYVVSAEVRAGDNSSCKTQLVTHSGNLGSQYAFPDSIHRFTSGVSTDCPSNLK